jgi:hypothetical protein
LRPVDEARPASVAGQTRPRATELLWAKPQAAAAPPTAELAGASATTTREAQSIAVGHAGPIPAAATAGLDMNRLVEEVMHRIERQARSERLRRGR